MANPSESPIINELHGPSFYRPLTERCRELFTTAEVELPNTHKLNLVFTTPGLWESDAGIVQAQGITNFATIVLQNLDGSRTTVTEITRSEEAVHNIETEVKILLFVRRPSIPYTPHIAEYRVLGIGGNEAIPWKAYIQEDNLPEVTTQEVLSISYLSAISNQIIDNTSTLDESARARPFLNNGEAVYHPSFDSIAPGMTEKIVTGLKKDGFKAEDFVRTTLSWLIGNPVAITRYDLEPETQQAIDLIKNKKVDDPRLAYLQWQLLSLPENGFPKQPV